MLTTILVNAIRMGTIFLFGCIGEILTEKSGNLNLGVPGIMYIGGIAGLIIGMVLARYGYDGAVKESIPGAIPGIRMLMSWIPGVIAAVTAAVMVFYPITTSKMNEITATLLARRKGES